MKEEWPIQKKKPKDVQGWIGQLKSVRWIRRICFEDADPFAWCSADEKMPMKSRKEKRIRTLRNLDDSVVIFKIVYL